MHITDLPVELLLDHLLPALKLQDLLSLTRTNKFFASVCNDDILWKLKLNRDFNFTANADTARESGFKVIYRGLRKPSVFTWGASSEGRLGLSHMPTGMDKHSSGVPFPAQVDIDARIVSLAAGGWSFHALDDQGSIHVWGQLKGEAYSMRRDGFSEPAKTAKTPHKLRISMSKTKDQPSELQKTVKFTGISCGRAHSAALSSSRQVWVFTSWGRPCLLTSDILDHKLGPGHTVVQVESGWTNVAMLMANGDVYVNWPGASWDDFSQQLTAQNQELDALDFDHPSRAHAEEGKIVPCWTLQIPMAPLRLPQIPASLPVLDPNAEEKIPTSLVRIAAGDNFIVGLTNKGHVLSIDLRSPSGATWLRNQFDIGRVAWTYLPEYSELESIKKHPTWATAPSEVSPERPAQPKGSLRITHISAHFQTFVAYSISPSVVLMGGQDYVRSTGQGALSNADVRVFPCTIIPSLQSRLKEDPVISVVLGDYHFVALTALGRVLSWGKYSNGALGLGDPRVLEVGAPGGFARIEERDMARGGRSNEPREEVLVPAEVKWGSDPKVAATGKKFCFAITASGWHTGALVIDLERAGDELRHTDSEEEMGVTDAEQFARWSLNAEPYQMPGISTAEPRSSRGGRASTYESPPFNPHPGGRAGL